MDRDPRAALQTQFARPPSARETSRARLAHALARDNRQILVHEQALVNDIDLLARNAQTLAAELQLLRRADQRWVTRLFEEIAKQLKLTDSWNSGEIDDRDPRWTFRSSPEKLFVRAK